MTGKSIIRGQQRVVIFFSIFLFLSHFGFKAAAQGEALPRATAAPSDATPKSQIPNKKGVPPIAEAGPEDITSENYPELIESFDYPNADISEVVKAISKLTGKNFIIDQNVRGKISIIAPSQITVADAYKAFLSALAVHGMAVVPSGKFWKIIPARDALKNSIETYGGDYYPNFDAYITRVFKLKYLNAEDFLQKFRDPQSKWGNTVAIPSTNSLIVTDYGSHVERIGSILKVLDVPGFEEKLEVIKINHAKSKDVADLLDQIINKGDRSNRMRSGVPRFRPPSSGSQSAGSGAESYSLVVPDERSNSIIVVGNQAGIEKIRGLIRKLDFPIRPEDAGGVYVYYVRHSDAEQVANVLNGIAAEAKKAKDERSRANPNLPPPLPGDLAAPTSDAGFGGSVKVTPDKITNSLVITASKQDYQVMLSILDKIDIARDQVFVKAIIMEMNADKTTDWGMNYYKFDSASKGIGRVGFSSNQNLVGALFPGSSETGAILNFGLGKTIDIQTGDGKTYPVPSLLSLIRLIQTSAEGNVLSTPTITALSNEQAFIEVGEDLPVGTNSTTTGSTVQNSTQRMKATIKLDITPYISPDTDSVRMKIDQTISQPGSKTELATDLQKTSIALLTREVKTNIVVESGDTAVLGGLMNDQESVTESKIPLLGDIPILGWLFKSKKVEKKKTNLVIFLTPKIIRTLDDSHEVLNARLNERVEFMKKNLRGRDPHGEYIDAFPRKQASQYQRKRPSSAPSKNKEEEKPVELEEPAVETF